MKTYKYCPLCSDKLNENIIDDRSRKFCKSCGWVYYLNPLPAVACILKDDEGRILLVKRGVEPQIGKWSLPAGFIEIDETPEQAVLRELKEETGIRGKIIKLIGVYSQQSEIYKNIITLGYLIKRISGRVEAGDDAMDVKFEFVEDFEGMPFESHKNMMADIEKQNV